ncbi:TPA: hypothetical protein SCS57_002023 [Enterobacter cloacae]|nr:hypothetical protein [Enterobacter cloacae]
MSTLITNKNEFTMSYDEIMRIKTGSGITQLMKLIYCRVLRFTENGNECFMSNQALADEFGTTPRSITDATNALVGLNAMIKNHRFNDSNIYIPLLWNDSNKFSPEYLAEIERKKKAKKSKKAGDEETSSLIITSNNDENNSSHEETSTLEVKKLQGGIEETSSLDLKKLPSNKEYNKQLNIQPNKQEKEVVEVINENSHKEEDNKEDSKSVSLPSSDKPLPSIVTSSSGGDIKQFNQDAFIKWLKDNQVYLRENRISHTEYKRLFMEDSFLCHLIL